MTPLTRIDARRLVIEAKEAKGITWQQLADEVGGSLVWTTSALLGQQPLDAKQARTAATLLGLGEDAVTAMQLRPVRGAEAMDPTEPVTYRFREAVQVYGAALHELIGEEFGDGIMSAIDFSLDFERVPDPNGDRVKITWNGKFLPYPGRVGTGLPVSSEVDL